MIIIIIIIIIIVIFPQQATCYHQCMTYNCCDFLINLI
ncbi:hypothetical protein GLYMA_08G179350v4 [Glycine max]|nr:hypothetical protein GLYMA_08G179350v4 [Glycine max]KAH1051797.1 hypothetical protein GYH30_021609 [Glycine max]